MNFDERPLKNTFLRFVLPSILSQWVYALYNMIDGMFVAKGVSEIALTAVNLSNPLLQLLFSVSLLFAVGTSTVAAIFLGREQPRRASEVFTQNVVVQLIFSAAIMALVLPNMDAVAQFLGAQDPETLGYVKEYLWFIVPFAPGFLLSYAFEVLLKTDGFPRKTVFIVTLGAVENCILDYLMVFVFQKGVAGAAFATSISQCSVTVLYLLHFLRGRGTIRFVKFRFDIPLLGREVCNGFSAALTEMSAGLVTLIFNRAILTFLFRDALVSYAIVSYINTIVVFSVTGIVQGSQPLVSYYYGRERYEKCKLLLRYCLVTTMVFCMATLAVCWVGTRGIVAFYISPELAELRDYSVVAIRIFTLSFLLLGPNIVISGYLSALEYALPAVLISAGRGFAFLIASLALLTPLLGGQGVWWAPLLSESLCLLMAVALLLRSKNKLFRSSRAKDA